MCMKESYLIWHIYIVGVGMCYYYHIIIYSYTVNYSVIAPLFFFDIVVVVVVGSSGGRDCRNFGLSLSISLALRPHRLSWLFGCSFVDFCLSQFPFLTPSSSFSLHSHIIIMYIMNIQVYLYLHTCPIYISRIYDMYHVEKFI